MSKVFVRDTVDSDIPEFVRILDQYDADVFWPDHLRIPAPRKDEGLLISWWKSFVLDSVTVLDDGRIVGCGFLDAISYGHSASINLFRRKWYRNPRAAAAIASRVTPLFFERHQLEKLIGYINMEHEGCIAMARRCGFRMDGISRRHLKINGKWVDYVIMSILKEEAWKQSRRLWVRLLT
jgi:RimJ/RimL family protein N-acetyltransferase